MTSRQPGMMPPGTKRPAGAPLHQGREAMTSRQPGTMLPGTGAQGKAPPGSAGQDWARWVPVALLIVLGLAGLRGVTGTPRWNGPLHQDGVTIGLLLEAVLAVLVVITLRRTRTGSQEAVPLKLRGMLLFTLAAGMVAVAVATLVGLHLHLFSRHTITPPPRPTTSPRPLTVLGPRAAAAGRGRIIIVWSYPVLSGG